MIMTNKDGQTIDQDRGKRHRQENVVLTFGDGGGDISNINTSNATQCCVYERCSMLLLLLLAGHMLVDKAKIINTISKNVDVVVGAADDDNQRHLGKQENSSRAHESQHNRTPKGLATTDAHMHTDGIDRHVRRSHSDCSRGHKKLSSLPSARTRMREDGQKIEMT